MSTYKVCFCAEQGISNKCTQPVFMYTVSCKRMCTSIDKQLRGLSLPKSILLPVDVSKNLLDEYIQ